jgi:hypothetical protein
VNVDNDAPGAMEKRKAMFTGKGIVVLSSQRKATEVVEDGQTSCLHWFLRTFCFFLYDPKDFWEIERAYEPSEIAWEYMNVS